LESGGRRGGSVVRTCVRERRRPAVSWGARPTCATLKCPPPPQQPVDGHARPATGGGLAGRKSRRCPARAHDPHTAWSTKQDRSRAHGCCARALEGGGPGFKWRAGRGMRAGSAGCVPPVNGTPPSEGARCSAVGARRRFGLARLPPPRRLNKRCRKGGVYGRQGSGSRSHDQLA